MTAMSTGNLPLDGTPRTPAGRAAAEYHGR
jgi:hypothetical protein